MSYYDSDEDFNVHVRHRAHSPRPAPQPVRYVQRSPPRPRYEAAPAWLSPDQQRDTVIVRSRSRSRSRDRRRDNPSPAPAAPQPQPVIIHNNMYNDYSSDSEPEYNDRRKQKGQLTRRPRYSSSSHSRSRSKERTRHAAAKSEWEAEHTRMELERLRLAQSKDRDERRLAKQYTDDAELQQAKRELDDIKRREKLADEEKRIKKEMEHKRLKEEQEAAEEEELRKIEAELAVERYKQEETKRIAKEKEEKELADKEYQRRMQEQLVASGVDEKDIAAIMKKEKVRAAEAEAAYSQQSGALSRPMYTRMPRKHLSIETLRTFHIEWDWDQDAEYVLIKRWVPEWEQNDLWKHTRELRKRRGKALLVEEKSSHRHYDDDPRFEWVRKKSHSRKRSKSPGLLMWMAGARPA